jgi:hypothetical protein
MFKASIIFLAAVFLWSPVFAEEPGESGDKVLSGMSIVGNDDAPKSLVIVPWKSSELGTRLDVSQIVDDGRKPVDREVFMRELNYYRISTE